MKFGFRREPESGPASHWLTWVMSPPSFRMACRRTMRAWPTEAAARTWPAAAPCSERSGVACSEAAYSEVIADGSMMASGVKRGGMQYKEGEQQRRL